MLHQWSLLKYFDYKDSPALLLVVVKTKSMEIYKALIYMQKLFHCMHGFVLPMPAYLLHNL